MNDKPEAAKPFVTRLYKLERRMLRDLSGVFPPTANTKRKNGQKVFKKISSSELIRLAIKELHSKHVPARW